MRTLAALAFIAGAAVLAIGLARTPTVADGRVMAADLIAQWHADGVVGMVCDRRIPIGRRGAEFTCTATFDDGASQALACRMDRAGQVSAEPVTERQRDGRGDRDRRTNRRRISVPVDPWAN